MFNLGIIISIIVIYLLICFVISKIFKKGSIKQYKAYIPIVNFINLLKLNDFKWYYIFLFLISPVNIWLYIYYNIRLGKKFNKKSGFIVGMIFLPIIFYIILAFNKDELEELILQEHMFLKMNWMKVLLINLKDLSFYLYFYVL